ncbi:WD40 repeat domain-containing protein [Prosthecobacter sp.]|uniref:WD40 repeat domain-containing protein n=1 Tax=Prosthecobacter sp. TaxID=1965333 RepID=UPI001D9A856D|nr:WD40 repeat domain-containing protein [Prosthecobacter sp.]MCB1278227.1 WD40 repeat domain-containing protein [Prosthecobacter sp.]
MSEKKWQIQCPKCRRSTQLTEDDLRARHLIGTMSVMSDPTEARKVLEDYTIACPRCDALMPFEPRSEYRRRKALAVSQRINRLIDEIEGLQGDERDFLALAGKCAAIALEMLETDMPTDSLYECEDKLLSALGEEIKKTGADPKRHRAWRWLQEIFAIACSGIRERDDLPELPPDEVEEKRAELLKALEDLKEERGEKRPHAAAPRASPDAPESSPQSEGNVRFRFERAHDNNVEAVAISRDGRIGLSVGWNPHVRVWDLETGRELRQLKAGGNFLTSVIFLGDESRVAAAGADGAVWIWELASGRRLHRLNKHSFTIHSIAASADGRLLISGSGDGTARLWDTVKGSHLRKFGGFFGRTLPGAVSAVALSSDGAWALTGGGECADTVKVWDVSNGLEARTAHFPDRAVKAIHFLPEKWKAVVQSGSKLLILDVTEGRVIGQLANGNDDYFDAFNLAADGRWASAASGSKVCVIKTNTGVQQHLSGHQPARSIYATAITPDGRRVISGSNDLSVIVWNV